MTVFRGHLWSRDTRKLVFPEPEKGQSWQGQWISNSKDQGGHLLLKRRSMSAVLHLTVLSGERARDLSVVHHFTVIVTPMKSDQRRQSNFCLAANFV